MELNLTLLGTLLKECKCGCGSLISCFDIRKRPRTYLYTHALRERPSQRGRIITWGAKIAEAKRGKPRPDMQRQEYRDKMRDIMRPIALKNNTGQRLIDYNKLPENKAKRRAGLPRGERHWGWKGGIAADPSYRGFMEKRRRLRKTTNGGSHTLQDWHTLKTLYNNMCLACGKQEPTIKLHEDHIVPLCKGGNDNIGNIQPLCKNCNSRKHQSQYDYRTHEPGLVQGLN